TRDLIRAADAQARDLVTTQAADALSAKYDMAGIGREHLRDAIEQRRLAGSVGADQPDDLTFADTEAHPIQCSIASKALRELPDFRQGPPGLQVGPCIGKGIRGRRGMPRWNRENIFARQSAKERRPPYDRRTQQAARQEAPDEENDRAVNRSLHGGDVNQKPLL